MKWKKMVAPIVVTVILAIYLIVYSVTLLSVIEEPLIRLAAGIIPLGLLGVSIYVLIERIREIRSGEEDDLSKY